MGERLAARKRQVHHLHRRQVLEKLEILLSRERPAGQAEVVVAEEAVEVAAVGQLEEDREQQIVPPGPGDDVGEAHRATTARGVTPAGLRRRRSGNVAKSFIGIYLRIHQIGLAGDPWSATTGQRKRIWPSSR